jgi:hypothetical protein
VGLDGMGSNARELGIPAEGWGGHRQLARAVVAGEQSRGSAMRGRKVGLDGVGNNAGELGIPTEGGGGGGADSWLERW